MHLKLKTTVNTAIVLTFRREKERERERECCNKPCYEFIIISSLLISTSKKRIISLK